MGREEISKHKYYFVTYRGNPWTGNFFRNRIYRYPENNLTHEKYNLTHVVSHCYFHFPKELDDLEIYYHVPRKGRRGRSYCLGGVRELNRKIYLRKAS